MNVTIRLPEKVGYILEELEKNGFEGYVVGGCVRDSVLGRIPGDWDITTSAKPEEVKRIFRRTIDTGIAHGTVTVMLEDEGFEVTTYRVDGKYEDHRHPESVEFTPNLEEDLKRRDFTINAMAYNPRTGIVDLFDGMGDIRRKKIRCVGNPLERFSEDALRMFRGVRFAGQLGFEVEDDTLQAIGELAHTIRRVSAERVRVELTKLLLSEEPEKLMLAERTGLCQYFFPEFQTMLTTSQNNPHHCYSVGEHCLYAVKQIRQLADRLPQDVPPYGGTFSREKVNTILVFAALLHDVGKPECKSTDENGIDHFYGHDAAGVGKVSEILHRLRFDNDTIRMVKGIIRYHERRYDGNRRSLRRLINQAGVDVMPYLFLLQRADVLTQSDYQREEKLARIEEAYVMFQDILSANEPVSMRDLAVTGKDILALGIKPGPQVGELLQMLLELVIEDPGKNYSKHLLTEVEKCIKIDKKGFAEFTHER